MSDETFDVAIIGYGPTGVTAANLLGAMGHRVLVVEREADIYSRARAISTDEEVLRIWQTTGLVDRLKEDMLPERTTAFVDADQRILGSVYPESKGHGHPPQSFIYQPALEQVLRDGVDRYPNVDIRLQHDSLKVRDTGGVVELLLHDIRQDALVHASARYVIACDGGSSPTRGSLGIGFDGTTYEDRWVVIDTKMKKEWPNHDFLRFHCDPARPAVDCPTPLGHHRWEFPILPGEDEAALVSDEGVWRLLAGHGITPDNVDILRAVVYSHHVRFASQWRRGRIFLAGDAAHVMPPWIGQGMAAGVRDAANLCWKLDAVLRGQLDVAVLDSYETERKPHVREVTKRGVLVGRIITHRRTRTAKLRDLMLRLVNRSPRVMIGVQGRLWIPDANYADSWNGGRSHDAVGHKIPQPTVIDDHGMDRLLDDALPSGWVILHTGNAPTDAAWNATATVIRVAAAGAAPAEGAVVDRDGTLHAWFDSHGAATVVLRPDRFVYDATAESALMPCPLRPMGAVA